MTTRATRGPRRRTVVALAVILSVLVAFVVRLIDIQVVSADEHVSQSLEHIGDGSTIPGQRGSIVDAEGTVLASTPSIRPLKGMLLRQYRYTSGIDTTLIGCRREREREREVNNDR